MKPKTLIRLLLALAALAAAATWYWKARNGAPPPVTGQRVLRVEDINTVARVDIGSGTQRVELARGEAGWTVVNRWNHPANFEQIAETLRALDGLRIGEVIRGGESLLEEFGLTDKGPALPALVKLYGADGKVADEVLIGAPRATAAGPAGFSLPDSRYMRQGRGPVLLVEPYLDEVQRRPSDWLDRTIMDVQAGSVQSMTAVPTNDYLYAVNRTAEGSFAGVNALEDKPINTPGADLWFRAFQGVTATDVVDPALPHAKLGREEAEVAIARTTNGVVYRVELGATANEVGDRYAWFGVDYEGPDEEAYAGVRAETERLKTRLAPWTYTISDSQAKKFLFLKDQLIAADPPAAEAPAAAP